MFSICRAKMCECVLTLRTIYVRKFSSSFYYQKRARNKEHLDMFVRRECDSTTDLTLHFWLHIITKKGSAAEGLLISSME